MAISPPRVVLDTNVCLDLFVFADRRCASLGEALRAGEIEAVTCASCRDEWLGVLGYPQLALAASSREHARAAFDASVRLLDLPSGTSPLPRCADPDDQKFLQLAAGAAARWLLSRDSALLRLGRRTLRTAGFAVLTPEQWANARQAPATAAS